MGNFPFKINSSTYHKVMLSFAQICILVMSEWKGHCSQIYDFKIVDLANVTITM